MFLAAGARFSYDVTISNTNEAGFTAYLEVMTPTVFILDRAVSILCVCSVLASNVVICRNHSHNLHWLLDDVILTDAC